MSALEMRYRRLLATYPRDHRAEHEEEMLGVLLATAKPGQRRPAIRDTLDLLRGALLIRARRPWRDIEGAWADGLAIVSLLGPVLLSGYAVIVGPQDGYYRVTPSGEIVRVYPWFIWVGWPLVLLAITVGWRRLAVLAAWVGGLTLPFYYWSWEIVFAVWFPLAALSAVALTWSPGPARGLALLGRPRFACYLIGVALLDIGVTAVYEFHVAPSQSWPVTLLLWAGAVMVVGAAMDFGSQAGRRAAVWLAMGVAWLFMWHSMWSYRATVTPMVYFVVPFVALACVGGAVWLIERRLQRTAPDGPAERRATPA